MNENNTEKLRNSIGLYNKAISDLGNANCDIPIPDGLEDRLSAAIDLAMQAEHSQAELLMARPKRRLFKFTAFIGAVASLALLIVAGVSMLKSNPSEPVDTFTDPAEAYIEANRALTLFANTLNRGARGVEMADDINDRALALAFDSLSKI
ncbi:MAG: hypothetical protein K2G64_07635 [Muribaculaceae bacterium]|nr:hypothetical protein [Muribaculaceae bacterium]